VIISSGNLRVLNNTAGTGAASVGNLYFTSDLSPAQIVVDASVGGGQGTGTLIERL